jgi:HlyD family secretion protein
MNLRNIIIGIVVLVVLGIAFLTVGGGSAMLAPQPTPTPNTALLDLENIVSASGTLVPAKRANIALQGTLPARVVQVAVKTGDVVKPGDMLIKLYAAEEEAAVNVARATLAQLKTGATREEIAVAQANLNAAKAQLAKVRASATPEDIAMAKATLERAAAVLRDAQSQYDRIKDDPQRGMYPQSQTLHLATQDYRIAEARYYQVVKGATPEDIRVAEANVAIAQASLDRVKATTRPEEITAAQAKLDQATSALAALTLTAPFSGTIASVNVKEGETITPGVPVLTLGELSNLRLETDDLSETNIARIKLGQIVNVTFDALIGKTFKGTVTYISPMASAKQGGTNYTIYVDFDNLDPALRWGMTGHIEINTKQ